MLGGVCGVYAAVAADSEFTMCMWWELGFVEV